MCSADTEKRVWLKLPEIVHSQQEPDVTDSDAPQLTSGDLTKNEILLAPAPHSSEQKTKTAVKMEEKLQAFCANHHDRVHG